MDNKSVEDFFIANNFDIIAVENVDEVAGTCFCVKHRLSGLRLMYIKNNDVNKSFSISFKTPPVDNTGVFHILEHSVLCGSKKYPVKEPFVNLLKSSMQTFLNAMTFPDKTVYPVSSTNYHDLENLMRIYLDAVFNPRIYDEENIFLQEGWHKEVCADGTLEYNGVVYSEMKGALSDVDQMCYFELSKRIFAGSCYAFESGGLPEDIPKLTYEKFLDTHARHYSPKNSYVVLYGDLDIEYFTNIIMDEFVMPAFHSDDLSILPNEIGKIGEIDKRLGITYMDIDGSANTFACGFVVNSDFDPADIFSLNAIFTYLMASNDSPLKKRLLDVKLADDFYVQIIDSLLTPAIMFVAKGVKSADDAGKLKELFIASVSDIVSSTIDSSGVMAAINNMKYFCREKNYGISDGVYYAIKALDSWLYDENEPLTYLQYERIFSDIEQRSNTSYFDDLLTTYIINNDKYSSVLVMSKHDRDKSKKEQVLPDGEAADINKCVEKLKAFQSTPDSVEAIKSLPSLGIADIEDVKCPLKYDIYKSSDITYIKHDLDVSGIDYFNLYFDIKHLKLEDIHYLSLLCGFLTNFDTEMLKASDIQTYLLDTFGSLTFNVDVVDHAFDDGYEAKFLVGISCLSNKTKRAFDFIKSLLKTTDFGDIEKIKSLLIQTKLTLDQDIINSGHTYATLRSASHMRASSKISEVAGGVEYLLFLNDGISYMDDFAEKVSRKLSELLHQVISGTNLIVSHNSDVSRAQTLINSLELSLNLDDKNLEVVVDGQKNEGFIANTNVSFSALRADARCLVPGFTPSAAWTILQRILSYDYLWNTIRVMGGAYGCGFKCTTSGMMGYHTYRDPNVDASYAIMKDASKFVSELELSDEEFDGYVISAIGAHDAPLKAKSAMRKGDILYFSGLDVDWCDLQRKELLQVGISDIKELGPVLTKVWDNSSKCTIGNASLLENTDIFDCVIRL